MLRLTLEGNEIDLYEDVSVNLTLQFTDVQNINSPAGSFSQTFRVPATPNNLDYFGPINDTTAVGVSNVKQRIPAQLLRDSIPLISGFCQIKAVYLQKEKYADIELVFFGGAVDLKSAVGDGMLSDLDLSSLDHELNRTNLENSWTASTGIAPHIRYGLVDRGFNWSQEGNDEGNPPWRSDEGIYQNQFTPFVSLYSLLNAVLTEAGFTFESDFFVDPASASPTQDMYMPCVNGNVYPEAEEKPSNNCVAINSAQVFENSGGTQTGTLQLKDNILDAWDVGGNFNATTYQYTAPVAGRYSIRLKASLGGFNSTYTTSIKMYIYKNGAEYDQPVNLFLPTSSNQFTQTATWTYSGYGHDGTGFQRNGIDLGVGDTLEVRYEVDNYGLIRGGTTLGLTQNTTVFFVDDTSPANSEFDVDVAASLPEVKQIDFLVGLQKMFNLVFVPDKNKPSHLIIEPFQDYVATGTQYDWTSKVDYSKDVTIKPTTDLQKKETLWTYKKGGDFISDAVQKSLDRVYGEYKITEPGNDFAKGNQRIETTFGQYMMSLIPGMGIPIHRSLQADGQPVKNPLPMVAYWTGLSSAYGDWFLEDDISSPGTVTKTELPIFSNYSDRVARVSSFDLNYGSEAPFIPIEVNSANTLYFEYWAQYATELYSNEARIMTCHMRLDNVDLAGFEFSDNIFIKDEYWRVLKIEYDANVEGLCKVELIKILSDVAICEDIPTGYDRAYQYVLFNNSSISAPDFGSQTCCERYGYEWVKVPIGPARPGATSPMNLCRARLITTPPTQ